MAGIKISALPITGSAAPTDEIPTNTLGGTPTVRRTLAQAVQGGLLSVGPWAIGGAADANIQVYLRGSFTGGGSAYGLRIDSTLTPAVSGDAHGTYLRPTLNKAGSGTHADFSTLLLDTPQIGAGAATLTSASTLKITGAPTAATNNYALWAAGPHVSQFGSGGTSGDGPAINFNGGSGSGGGAYLRFMRNSVVKGYIGNESAINGGTSDDFTIYTNAGSAFRVYVGSAEQVRFLETASATRYITLTGSNGASPQISTSAGNLRTPNGLIIGADSTNGLIDDASNGAGTTALFIGNAQITAVSDRRLKVDIRDTERDALAIFGKLRVVDHAWSDPADQGPNNRNARGVWTGLIAQEADAHIPWIVNRPRGGPDFMWQMDYNYMAPMFVRGFQQVDERLRALEART